MHHIPQLVYLETIDYKVDDDFEYAQIPALASHLGHTRAEFFEENEKLYFIAANNIGDINRAFLLVELAK